VKSVSAVPPSGNDNVVIATGDSRWQPNNRLSKGPVDKAAVLPDFESSSSRTARSVPVDTVIAKTDL